jgi:hypothetical protein
MEFELWMVDKGLSSSMKEIALFVQKYICNVSNIMQ